MKPLQIGDLIKRQRDYFSGGATRDVSFRLEQLDKLKAALKSNERAILEALDADLKKPPAEAYTSELGIVLADIAFVRRRVRKWAGPRRVKNPPIHKYTKSFIYPEPYGVALIIAPWNYPVQLLLSPLVGAIAAGNTAVLKPSEISLNTSHVLTRIIGDTFDPAYIACVEGGPEASQALLKEQFDYIFYTGSTAVGRLVMEAAAKGPTPVTLELGGKSPCIVEDDVQITQTARRIVWGKYFNAGQTCIAPDYLLVNRKIKDRLLKEIKDTIARFYGPDPRKSPDYARIVNDRHFDRLAGLLSKGRIFVGGTKDKGERYIAPTVVENVSPTDPVMGEEIFGPILPVIEYDDLSQAIDFVKARPRPLSLYFFSRDKDKQDRVLRETLSGGVGINDTLIHITSPYLPFGGNGASGMGSYHGKASFDTFTHYKSVLKQTFLFDLTLRYLPYRLPLGFYRWVMKLFK
jgi:acyl-CoA reductase-like NAD-dependent aldehyde dehydrogenase